MGAVVLMLGNYSSNPSPVDKLGLTSFSNLVVPAIAASLPVKCIIVVNKATINPQADAANLLPIFRIYLPYYTYTLL